MTNTGKCKNFARKFFPRFAFRLSQINEIIFFGIRCQISSKKNPHMSSENDKRNFFFFLSLLYWKHPPNFFSNKVCTSQTVTREKFTWLLLSNEWWYVLGSNYTRSLNFRTNPQFLYNRKMNWFENFPSQYLGYPMMVLPIANIVAFLTLFGATIHFSRCC